MKFYTNELSSWRSGVGSHESRHERYTSHVASIDECVTGIRDRVELRGVLFVMIGV